LIAVGGQGSAEVFHKVLTVQGFLQAPERGIDELAQGFGISALGLRIWDARSVYVVHHISDPISYIRVNFEKSKRDFNAIKIGWPKLDSMKGGVR
jgi:hypothetical protein